MADDLEESVEAQTQDASKEKKHNTGSSDLEKVTDFAEEKELGAGGLESVCVHSLADPRLQAFLSSLGNGKRLQMRG